MRSWQKALRLAQVMAKWNRNREGYADSTASIAIQKVSREERKIGMGKKRNCRRTTDENIIHEKAVKMRKMTDEQLVHYVEDRVEKARSEGKNEAKKGGSLRKFLESLATPGVIPGVGSATVDKVRKYAEECGFFE